MFKFLLTLILFLSIYFTSSFTQAQTISCINLQYDLSKGDSNSSVSLLQNFLKSNGYLEAIPNGYFGVATLSAVKQFQLANLIQTTGTVGPITRSIIQKKTCANEINNTNDSIVSTAKVSAFISPKEADYLRIGDSMNIAWYGDTNYIHDIILEYPNGSGAGYIATSLSGENSYKWKIGNVYDAGSQTNINVATGTYRIRIRKSNSNITSSDPVSNLFTLTAPPLSISSVSQSIITADDKQAVVVYGSGFDSSSVVQFDYQYGVTAHNLYVSPDGKILVFSVSPFVSIGNHYLMVSNSYGMVSNSLNVNIIK